MLILECLESVQMCCDARPFLKIVDLFITILQIGVPIILIVLSAIDVFKMMVNNDDKDNSKTIKSLIRRFIYAALIFIIPWLVELSLSFVENFIINKEASGDAFTEVSATSWVQCWNHLDDDSWCNQCNNIYEK